MAIEETPIEPGTGYFDKPRELERVPEPDLPDSFPNPFGSVAGAPYGSSFNKQFDLKDAMTDLAHKKPSFQAQTAPVFFDWEKSQADRYVNSDYFQELGFLPNRDNETLYGNRQTFGDVMENAFAGGGSLAWNTFVDGWKGWGRMVDALASLDGSKLMGSPEELAELDKEQKRIMNKYAIFRTPESEGSIFNRQFFGDMIQQSGFALGAIGQFALEELVTLGIATAFKPLTGARAVANIARGVEQGEVMANIKRLGDVAWKGKMATRLYEGLKAAGKYTPIAGNLFDAGRSLWKAKTYGTNIWEVGGITLNGLRRTMAEANMAFTESRMEAAGTYAELKSSLYDEHLKEHGSVTYEDERRIEEMAQAGAWSNFNANAATISIMNRLQFDNLFRKFSADKRAMRELAEAGEDVSKKVNRVTGTARRDITVQGGNIGVKAGQQLTQVYEKGALGTFGNLRKIATDFSKKTAAWEATKSVGRNLFKWELSEGVQELIQEGSNQAIKDYYTDLYISGKGNWMESADVAIDNLQNVNGLKTFLMGALTGRFISPVNRFFNFAGNKLIPSATRKAADESRKLAIDTINGYFKDPSHYAPEAIANLKVQNRGAEIMEAALASNDRYAYEHAKDGMFAKAVSAAKKLNMLESLTDSIEAYGDHFNEQEFKEAFSGVDFNDESRQTVKQYMKKVADDIKAFSKRYDRLRDTYADLVQPERYAKGKDREQALSVKRALDEAVEWMATNEYRAESSAKRGLAIIETAAQLPTVGKSAYMAFRILGDDVALDKELNLLNQEIESMKAATVEDEGFKQQLLQKEQQQAALSKLKLFEEGGVDTFMDALRHYINAKNKELGNNTQVAPNDLQELYFQLRDYSRLQKDERNFMDAYALLANPKTFMGVFMRIREGLDYVKEEKKAQQLSALEEEGGKAKATPSAANPDDQEEQKLTATAGTTINEYRGFRVGDKITYQKGGKEQGPFNIERISTTRVELFNTKNNVKENLSLDRFDELIQENKVKRLGREEQFGTTLQKGKTLIDGKEGIYMVEVVQNSSTYYVLTDGNENLLNEEGELINQGESPITYKDKTLANDARNKMLSLRGEREKEERAPYTFDGKQVKLNDILIKEDKRYRVITSREPETQDDKPVIRLQLLGGTDTDIITIDSLEGYELATEAAAVRTKTKKANANKFKLKVSDVLTGVQGVIKQGESQEVANKRLQEFIRSVTSKDFLKNLVIKISRNPTWKANKETTHRENQNLQVRGNNIEAQIIYKNELIGTLPHYLFYQYLDENGKPVEMSRLTREQFQQIFDVAPGDVTQALKEVQENYVLTRKAFHEFYNQLNEKGDFELDEKEISNLFKFTLSTGDYDWAPTPSVPLKNLKYNGVGGKVVVIARRLGRGVKDKLVSNESILTESALNDEQKQALLKQINEQRFDSFKNDTTKNMGNYLAVVELPNKELRFVPLEMLAYEEKALDELVKEINEQSKLTRETNITEAQGNKSKAAAKDTAFNDAFNATLAEKLMMSVRPGLEVNVSLNAFGTLELTFFDIETKSHPTIRLTGKDAKSALAYTNFKELLTDINKKIAEYDSKQTDPRQHIDLELETNDFKKHLSDTPDFTEIKNLNTLVTEEVVSGGSIKVTYDTNKKNTVEVLLPDTTVPVSARKRKNGQKGVEAGVIEEPPPVTGSTTGGKGTTSTGTPPSGQTGGTPPSGQTGETPPSGQTGGTPPTAGEKVDELNKLKAALPKQKGDTLDKYKESGMQTTEAMKAMQKDGEVVAIEEKIKKLEDEINRETKVHKVIAAKLWSKGKGAVEKIDRFQKWVSSKLPEFIDVKEVELIKENMLKEGITVGQLVYSLKTLSEKKAVIEVDPQAPYKYHEAFHAVFRLLLSDVQIEKYLGIAKKEVKEKLSKEKTTLQKELKEMRELNPEYYEKLTEEELEKRYYEEHLADRFDEWKMDITIKTDPANKNLFRRILDWIVNVFKPYTAGELEGLFYSVNAGDFRGASLAVNQFTTDQRLKGNIEVTVPKSIKIGEMWVKDEEGGAVRINQYLPEEKGSALAAAIAATFHQRRESAGENRNADSILDEIFNDYAKLYDKENEQYVRNLENKDTYQKYFQQEPELDKLKALFTTGREALKEAVEKHFQSIEYLFNEEAEEEEDIVDELGDRATQDYKKSKESFGGFGSLPKWLRHYIATTTYKAEDTYGNTYLKEGEPLLQAVDSTMVYSGILKAVAGFDDKHKMLLRMREFARHNNQSAHFIERFFNDMGIELTDTRYDVVKEEMLHKFNMVMKGFQQYTPDYLLINKNLADQRTFITKANRRAAAGTQFSIWYNAYSQRFEHVYLQTADSQKIAFLNDKISGLELFRKQATNKPIGDAKWEEDALQISNELKEKLGLSFHPSFIKYSLACARTTKNQTTAQRQLVKTFGEVQSLKAEDAAEIISAIRSGKNPFTSDTDIRAAEANAARERTKRNRNEEDEEEERDSETRLREIAGSNAIFDETVNTTSFRNAEGELVYAHQLPTYHLVKIKELSTLLAKGAPIEAALNELLNDPYMAENFLMNSDAFREMAGDLRVTRIEGMKSYSETSTRKGVTYGKFTAREMMVSLFDLFGATQKYEGANGPFYTSQHLVRVIEATNTGDTVNLPVIQAVESSPFDGTKLSRAALDIMVAEVRKEFERIGRVQQEIAQIEEERFAFEENGTVRTLTEVDEYHNLRGANELQTKPRGLTLFKTGVMLGELTAELEKEAVGETPDFKDYKERIEQQLQAYWLGANGKVKETINLMRDMDIIRTPKDKNRAGYDNVLLPDFMVKGFQRPFQEEADEAQNRAMNLQPGDIEHNIAQVVINDFINTASFNQLLLGDQALSLKDYVDMVKRAKGANGGGPSIAFDIAAPSLGIHHAGRDSHIVQIDDPKFKGIYAGKMKEKADSQMWMTLKSLRYTLFGLGRLTPRLAGLLDKIERGEKVNIQEVFGKNGTISYDGQTNSIKMVYYDKGRYIKCTGFLLTKELTSIKDVKGNWEARRGCEELHALRTKLEDYEKRNDTICMAVPKSASKGEKANTARGILPVTRVSSAGKMEQVSPITDWNFQKLDNRYWRLQTENPSNKMIITDPTQAKQLIMLEQNDDLDVEFMWDRYGAPVSAGMKVGVLKKLYREQTAQRAKVKYRQARKELFNLEGTLEEISASIKAGKVTPKLAKFQERAIEVLQTTGADSQLLEFFTLDDNGQPKYDLNHPVTLDKFTQLFMAYFSKGVMNEKIPGHAITLVSNYGMRLVKEVLDVDANGQPKRWRVVRRVEYEKNPSEYKGALEWEADPDGTYYDEEARRKNAEEGRVFRTLTEQFEANKKSGKKTYILDDLRHNVPEYKLNGDKIMQDDDGNDIILGRYTEYMMAPHSAEAMRLMEETGELPDVLTKGFGVRIPSQAEHSLVNIRLVDFLPAHYGSSGMFAPELLEVSGSDLDGDKLYAAIKEHYTRSKNGKTEFIEYGRTKDEEEQFNEFVLYQKLSNKGFKKRYKELLAAHPSYTELKGKVLALRNVIQPFREAVKRGRHTSKSLNSVLWTKHSANVLFDEIFGMDTVGEETRTDLDELMKGLDRTAFLDELKAIEDEGAVNLKEWYNNYNYLSSLVEQVDEYITTKTLREFSLPETVKDYQKKVAEEGEQNIGKLNNIVLDAKMKLQGNEHMVQWKGIEPPIAYQIASVKPLEDVLKYLKKEFPILKDFLEEGNEDPDSFLGKVIAFINNKEGAQNIGPAVNAMMAFALMNTFKVEMRKKNSYDKNIWKFRLNGVDFKTYGNDRAYSGKDAKGEPIFEGDRILHNLSAIVSAMTDNAKDRLAAKLGLNVEAVGLVSNLVAQGVPLEWAITFIMQPVIREYYKRTYNLKAGLKTEEEEGIGPRAIGELMKQELTDKLGSELKKDVELTDDILKENITTNGENLNYQYNVLQSFLNLKDQTDYFNKVSGVMKLVKGMGTSHEASLDMQEKIDKLKLYEDDEVFNRTNVPFDLRQIMTGANKKKDHHDIIATYLNIFDEINNSLSKVMFIEHTDYFNRAGNIIKNNFRIRKFQTQDFHKRFKRTLISSLAMIGYDKMLLDKGRLNRRASLNNALIHDAEADKMPEGFMDVIEVVRDIRELLPNNYFVNQFLNVLPTSISNGKGEMVNNPYNSTGINKVEVNTWAKLNQLQIEKLQDSFLDIYQNDKTNHHAWALFHYLLVKDGGQFRSGSFIRYIPNFMFKDISDITGKINKLLAAAPDEKLYQEIFGMGSEELLNKFVRGYLLNVNNKEYIANVDLDPVKPKQVDVSPFDTEEEIEKKRGEEYVPETVVFYKDGTLEIDMDRGVRDEKKVTGPVKLGDVMDKKARKYTRKNDSEIARWVKNIEDLKRRGFWEGKETITKKKGAAKEISAIRFPYVIRGAGKGYYVLTEVDGVKQDINNPTSFLKGDNLVATGSTARYMPLKSLEGFESQWSGAFILGKLAERLESLRQRAPTINNGGFSLEEQRKQTAVKSALAKEVTAFEAYDVLYDFQDMYGVQVRYEEGKGLIFEKDGKRVDDQGEMKKTYLEFGENYVEIMRKGELMNTGEGVETETDEEVNEGVEGENLLETEENDLLSDTTIRDLEAEKLLERLKDGPLGCDGG